MPGKEKTIIQVAEGKVFEIKPNGKYLLILPQLNVNSDLNAALLKFFGKKQVLAVAVDDVNEVKIAELLEENVNQEES